MSHRHGHLIVPVLYGVITCAVVTKCVETNHNWLAVVATLPVIIYLSKSGIKELRERKSKSQKARDAKQDAKNQRKE